MRQDVKEFALATAMILAVAAFTFGLVAWCR